MPSRERPVDRANRRLVRTLLTLGDEIRLNRTMAGLSLATVSAGAGASPSQVSRIERGLIRHMDLETLARVMASVGLDLVMAGYPGRPALRDRGQVALEQRFLGRIGQSWRHRLEVPVTDDIRDARAWDMVLSRDGLQIGCECETRLIDLQAQVRRHQAKLAAGRVQRLIVVVADTHLNRSALAGTGSLLRADLPLGTRAVLAALAAGRDPGANGVVVL